MTAPTDIDAVELDSVQLSQDGQRLRLWVRNQAGRFVRFSLPAKWLNSILNALPRSACTEDVHALDSWSIEPMPTGHDLVLTLRTPEGQQVSFAIKPWQVEGMATIATYGSTAGGTKRVIH